MCSSRFSAMTSTKTRPIKTRSHTIPKDSHSKSMLSSNLSRCSHPHQDLRRILKFSQKWSWTAQIRKVASTSTIQDCTSITRISRLNWKPWLYRPCQKWAQKWKLNCPASIRAIISDWQTKKRMPACKASVSKTVTWQTMPLTWLTACAPPSSQTMTNKKQIRHSMSIWTGLRVRTDSSQTPSRWTIFHIRSQPGRGTTMRKCSRLGTVWLRSRSHLPSSAVANNQLSRKRLYLWTPSRNPLSSMVWWKMWCRSPRSQLKLSHGKCRHKRRMCRLSTKKPKKP